MSTGEKAAQAKELYRAVIDSQGASDGWHVNRALVSLAARECLEGAFPACVQNFARTIELTFAYPESFRSQYQQDTWRQLLSAAAAAQQSGRAARFVESAEAAASKQLESAATLLVLAVASATACRHDAPGAAYRHATSLNAAARVFTDQVECAAGDLTLE